MADHLFKTPDAPKGAPASELQAKLVEKAMVLLKLARAQFKIVTVDGQEHGDWMPPSTPAPRKFQRVNKGITDHVDPYIALLQKAGDVQIVPLGGFPPDAVQRLVAGRCSAIFGRGGTYTTHIRKDGTGVEVMLTADRPGGAPQAPQEEKKEEPDPLAGLSLDGLTQEQIEEARQLLK